MRFLRNEGNKMDYKSYKLKRPKNFIGKNKRRKDFIIFPFGLINWFLTSWDTRYHLLWTQIWFKSKIYSKFSVISFFLVDSNKPTNYTTRVLLISLPLKFKKKGKCFAYFNTSIDKAWLIIYFLINLRSDNLI